MKAKIKIDKEFELKTLEVFANVRYWEDAEINGIPDEVGSLTPCKKGDLWCPVIDIDSGQIKNWEHGKIANIHFKICDECAWGIKDNNDDLILSAEDGYVPTTLCPKESGYGDYIIMDIDSEGFITDWSFDIDDFIREEY